MGTFAGGAYPGGPPMGTYPVGTHPDGTPMEGPMGTPMEGPHRTRRPRWMTRRRTRRKAGEGREDTMEPMASFRIGENLNR
jgi:hypothetical protein